MHSPVIMTCIEKNIIYVEFLCPVSMSLIGDQSSQKRRAGPIQLSQNKEKQIQWTLQNISSSARLSEQMPIL